LTIVPEGLPKVGSHRLWEDWQRARLPQTGRVIAIIERVEGAFTHIPKSRGGQLWALKLDE